MAVVEYMAAEKNVIATKIDAIPTLVDDGVDGLLVEMDNQQEAAEKVLWLYRHPKEATEMKSKALKKVIENYDIKRVVDQHMEMFNKLISGGWVNCKVLFVGCTALKREERRVAA